MSEFEGMTGHLLEERVLGVCRAQYRGRLEWHEAAELVRKNQPPIKTPFAGKLQRLVRQQLGSDEVQFRTAVGSALDYHYGTDGFFEFNGAVVAFDLTMNPAKDEQRGSVLIVHAEELRNAAALAGRIVREMQSRLQRRCA